MGCGSGRRSCSMARARVTTQLPRNWIGIRRPREKRVGQQEEPARISWARPAPSPEADHLADERLDRELRELCARGAGVTPALAQDVVFWLDLGQSPTDVANWLRTQLGDAPTPARVPSQPGQAPPFAPESAPTLNPQNGAATRTESATASAPSAAVTPTVSPENGAAPPTEPAAGAVADAVVAPTLIPQSGAAPPTEPAAGAAPEPVVAAATTQQRRRRRLFGRRQAS
ncbi:MAG: hypothetical protein QOF40_1436 [Actinomycetota bacterium]|nr:hypothetical protein [Actinomycetota bacterium]